MIRDIVEVTNWPDLVDVNQTITNDVLKFVEQWGIEIEAITITDLGIVKTYRILGEEKPLLIQNSND
jgi:hypothetical protein